MEGKRRYKRISYKDRKIIEMMFKGGFDVSEVTEVIGVHRATMYRELERGGVVDSDYTQYSAELAQQNVK